MRLFRRVDQTVPVPPPAGMKWVIVKTFYARNGRPLSAIELWAEHLHPNEWGVIPSDRGVIALDRVSLAHVMFEAAKPHQIRKASIAALEQYRTRLDDRRLFTETRIRIAERNPE